MPLLQGGCEGFESLSVYMATKRIIKPVPLPTRPVLDFNQVVDYIEAKYKLKLRGGKKDFEQHLLLGGAEITNGGIIVISPQDILEKPELLPKWQRDLYNIFRKEFGDEFELRTSW